MVYLSLLILQFNLFLYEFILVFSKLSKLFLNFKARNYPESLTEDEQEVWFEIVQSRVQSGENGYLSFELFEKRLNRLKEADPNKSNLWQELEEYANRML